ncbi:hypothetical protein KKA49_04185 [Patescibacteria group bacterium]|nr:hypothetical protein [Patescibacteria group bacterium]
MAVPGLGQDDGPESDSGCVRRLTYQNDRFVGKGSMPKAGSISALGRYSRIMFMRLIVYYIYLLLVWGCFRYFVRLPEVIEELWFKPVIWLVPLFWWRMSLGGKPKLFNNKWFLSGGLGLLVGILFFSLIRIFGIRGEGVLDLNLLGVVLATAVVEELTFSGFILGLMDKFYKIKQVNLVMVGLMVVGVHLPINIFVYGVGGRELLGVVVWLFSVAVINGWVRQKTGNVVGSIIARFVLMLAVL